MKAGVMRIEYDIGSMDAAERKTFEAEAVGIAARHGFDVMTVGASCEDGCRDILFVKNIKKTKRAVNVEEAAKNPPPKKIELPKPKSKEVKV